MSRPTFTEGTGFTLRASFRNEQGQPNTPSTIRYRIDCLTTRRVVRNWTNVTPGSTVDISVTPDDNAILWDGNEKETKSLTVVADNDLPTQFVNSQEWFVKNLPTKNLGITP